MEKITFVETSSSKSACVLRKMIFKYPSSSANFLLVGQLKGDVGLLYEQALQ